MPSHAGATAWGWWARALFVAIALVAWPLIMLAPSRRWARGVARWGAWLWTRGARLPVNGEGLQQLAGVRQPCVLVANHASKLDAIVVLAALPLSFALVGKSELQRRAWLRWPLQRLGVLFVRRGGVKRGPSDTERAIDRLRGGDNLFFFPEGTFGDGPGLLPFHHGAFVASVAAGAPVVPVAIRGTRAVLRDLGCLPRRGPVAIEVGAAIDAEAGGDPGQQADTLLARARAFIAARCGEPDLGTDVPGADPGADLEGQ
ncbi:MAG: 1-acyl-sn-glycerol-3-phosphate acyltransferase [Phycisphaerales bacterium]|nr:1-acyl-sn-glycerol-3-phosphate acyltransferase [Phycisphaerales bacterium]